MTLKDLWQTWVTFNSFEWKTPMTLNDPCDFKLPPWPLTRFTIFCFSRNIFIEPIQWYIGYGGVATVPIICLKIITLTVCFYLKRFPHIMNVKFGLLIATIFTIVFGEYIPPGPKYKCPKRWVNFQIFSKFIA